MILFLIFESLSMLGVDSRCDVFFLIVSFIIVLILFKKDFVRCDRINFWNNFVWKVMS